MTLFSCDTFGFYVSWVYLQYGVQVVTRQFPTSSLPSEEPAPTIDGAFVGIILALLMLVTSYLFRAASRSSLFHRHVRRFLADYGMPISLVSASAVAYWGRFNLSNPTTLPVGRAFQPAGDRDWLVRFWQLDGKWVGIAFPFGFALWVLFYFDHNVSVGVNILIDAVHETEAQSQSLMAQGAEFPLRKPPGFHYDFFLLGITTFIAGLLGIPAPNGLIPQAPIHTTSLLVMGRPPKRDHEDAAFQRPCVAPVARAKGPPSDSEGQHGVHPRSGNISATSMPESGVDPFAAKYHSVEIDVQRHEVPVAVVEQRVSNLAQGALCLVLLTGPFLHILNLIPRGVLAGLL